MKLIELTYVGEKQHKVWINANKIVTILWRETSTPHSLVCFDFPQGTKDGFNPYSISVIETPQKIQALIEEN